MLTVVPDVIKGLARGEKLIKQMHWFSRGDVTVLTDLIDATVVLSTPPVGNGLAVGGMNTTVGKGQKCKGVILTRFFNKSVGEFMIEHRTTIVGELKDVDTVVTKSIVLSDTVDDCVD